MLYQYVYIDLFFKWSVKEIAVSSVTNPRSVHPLHTVRLTDQSVLWASLHTSLRENNSSLSWSCPVCAWTHYPSVPEHFLLSFIRTTLQVLGSVDFFMLQLIFDSLLFSFLICCLFLPQKKKICTCICRLWESLAEKTTKHVDTVESLQHMWTCEEQNRGRNPAGGAAGLPPG